MDRRSFLRTSAAAAAGTLLTPGLALPHTGRADLILRGATVFDGSGAPGRELDVAVSGDRIAAVGRALPRGAEELDLRGLALAPGFIDIHSHADLPLFVEPKAESRIRQGVTLEIVGQDGSSIGPWSEEAYQRTRERYQQEYGVDIDFRDPSGFLAAIDRLRPAVNVATMVGNGTVRGLVIGDDDRPATAAELERMKDEVRKAMDGGCVGISSGLEYTPSGFADTAELGALASVLHGTGYRYATHMRNEDDRVLGAVEEAVFIGRLGGLPVEISHLKTQGRRNFWKEAVILDLFQKARADGVRVRFDVYPYTAYQTGLSNLFPTAMRAGGTDAFLARLHEPATAATLEAACRAKVELLGDWNAVQITTAGKDAAWAAGRHLGDLAKQRGVDPYSLVLQLLEASHGGAGMIGHAMGEENVERLVAHPLSAICSDGSAYAPYGPLSRSSPHPRAYGTFPRVLGRYVRERKALTLEAAIHKCTGEPARRLQLRDRGRIAAGAVADLVAFDPATVEDRATYQNPHQYPVGIPVVVVNGVVTLRDGEHTGKLAGRGVRGGARV